MPTAPLFPSPLRLCAVLMFGLTASCTHSAAPVTPPAALRVNPLTTGQPGTSSQPMPTRWWRLYQDRQLEHWVERALANNQDLAQAEANVRALLAGIGEFQAQRLPATSLGFAATYGKDSDDQTLAQARDTHAASTWHLNPSVTLAYQVDLWGQVQAEIERAKAQAQAVAAVYDRVRLQVAAQTSRAYIDQCVYTARLDQARQALRSLDRSARLSDRQRQAGVATALDSERLLGLREQVRVRIPAFEVRRQIALFELSTLAGETAVANDQPCASIPSLKAPLPTGDGWHLLQRRPDVRQAERELQAAGLESAIVCADLYPKVRFGARLGTSDQHLSGLGSSRAITFGIGPLISWEFPNLQANRARLSKAEALQQAQRARHHSVALKALEDVRRALARYAGVQQRLAALQAALEHSQRSFALAQASYRAGTADGLTLLDSERELIALHDQHIEARGKVASAQIELFRALGGGW
nr:TolC family protein [uncultured Pseudomonas sp.]